MSNVQEWWTLERVDAAVDVLREFTSYGENAREAVSIRLGRTISADALQKALAKFGRGSPRSHCVSPLREPPPKLTTDGGGWNQWTTDSVVGADRPATGPDPDLTERVLAAVRYRPLDYVSLSDKLNVPTDEVKRSVQDAIRGGYDLCINDGNVSRRAMLGAAKGAPSGWNDGVGHHIVAITSDTHVGNMWAAEEELTRFIRYAYGLGARTVIHPGDVLDGVKAVLIPEQYLVGFDRQSLQATRVFPALEGLQYFAQTGNHDEYTSTDCGMDAGRALENRFREIGRNDWHHVGRCGSKIQVESATWELCHPHGGTGSNSGVMAVLEKIVNERDELPDFMCTGHFHKFCFGIRKGCHMISCATWQRKGSPFSNRIAGPWAVGGCIVEYDVLDDLSIDCVSTRFVSADRFAVAA